MHFHEKVPSAFTPVWENQVSPLKEVNFIHSLVFVFLFTHSLSIPPTPWFLESNPGSLPAELHRGPYPAYSLCFLWTVIERVIRIVRGERSIWSLLFIVYTQERDTNPRITGSQAHILL
jgi:hypothetical protein